MLLGLKVDNAIRPKLGNVWHKVTLFPTIVNNTVAQKQRQNSQGNQPASGGTGSHGGN